MAFSLVALSLTGDPSRGAAIMVAMTLAQVIGAIPITRLGKDLPTASVLRVLVAVRTAALVMIATLTAYGGSFAYLVLFAVVAGSVNGAAFAFLRSLLNELTPASRLPRALGIAATLNEVTFVLAPVIASGLGVISPAIAVLAVAALGAFPALLVPHVGKAHVPAVRHGSGSVLNPRIALWLMCAAAGGATVAAVEIGAVALALSFGYEPALAIIFTVPLCLASIAGGVWVSVRNTQASRKAVVAQLIAMALGAALAALQLSIAATVVGAVLIGSVLAPLGTHYSLMLDMLAPPHQRAEAFALLRTANAIGVILAGSALSVFSLSTALTAAAGAMCFATLAVGSGLHGHKSR